MNHDFFWSDKSMLLGSFLINLFSCLVTLFRSKVNSSNTVQEIDISMKIEQFRDWWLMKFLLPKKEHNSKFLMRPLKNSRTFRQFSKYQKIMCIKNPDQPVIVQIYLLKYTPVSFSFLCFQGITVVCKCLQHCRHKVTDNKW